MLRGVPSSARCVSSRACRLKSERAAEWGVVGEDAGRRRPVTMQDVAAEAGVSRALVSLVIRDAPHVTEAKRAAVLTAIDKLGYRRNRLASRLASRRTATLGLLVLDVRNPVWADVMEGASDAAEQAGHHVLIAVGSSDADREREALQSLLEMQVDGVVLAGYMGRASVLRQLAGTPAVMLMRHVAIPSVDAVTGGDRHGAELAVEHLVELGHRRIAHVSSPAAVPYPARREGYLAAMARHGLTPQMYEGDLVESGGRAAVQALFDGTIDPPTALFCYNDVSAFGALEELDQRGLTVPDDVAVVGYDDSTVAGMSRIGLTSIDQHSQEIGRRGTALLLARIAEPGGEAIHETLVPELVVRSSTAPR